jgi:hypothetical protein
MSVYLSPIGGAGWQFFNNDGTVLAGGKLQTYIAGTSTPKTTYTTSAGNIAHTNPIVLDSAGRVPGGEIWLTAGFYKFVITTSTNVLIGTYDNISGIGAPEFQVQNSRINENNMRIASEASLVAILESEKILLSSTELMNEQVSTATKLFQSGAINALQLVEVLNRRADLILDLKKLNDSHIAVRTGLAKISNLKGIEL